MNWWKRKKEKEEEEEQGEEEEKSERMEGNLYVTWSMWKHFSANDGKSLGIFITTLYIYIYCPVSSSSFILFNLIFFCRRKKKV